MKAEALDSRLRGNDGDSDAEAPARLSRVGNVYINRYMIGAAAVAGKNVALLT